MRRKAHGAAQKDVALTERYKEIGISAVAAAVRYQRNGTSKKPAVARPKGRRVDKASFRGTSPRR
jgi:hypothetical protein